VVAGPAAKRMLGRSSNSPSGEIRPPPITTVFEAVRVFPDREKVCPVRRNARRFLPRRGCAIDDRCQRLICANLAQAGITERISSKAIVRMPIGYRETALL
jgi:hypothetical protein